MHEAFCERQSHTGSCQKTTVILSSCFAFLGSGLSCIGPRESSSCWIVFCPNCEQLITACCFSARWRLSWPSWRITLLFGTSFTCALTVGSEEFRCCWECGEEGHFDPTSVGKEGWSCWRISQQGGGSFSRQQFPYPQAYISWKHLQSDSSPHKPVQADWSHLWVPQLNWTELRPTDLPCS